MPKIVYNAIITVVLGVASIGCGDPCANKIVKEISFPKSNYKVVGFIRDCGATTDCGSHVSIIANNQILFNEAGNVFVGYHAYDIDIILKNDNTIIVSHQCEKENIYKSEQQFLEFRIEYKKKWNIAFNERTTDTVKEKTQPGFKCQYVMNLEMSENVLRHLGGRIRQFVLPIPLPAGFSKIMAAYPDYSFRRETGAGRKWPLGVSRTPRQAALYVFSEGNHKMRNV
jgi:hypothetical protein